MPAENQPPAVCPKCGEKFIRASLEGEMYECASVLLPSGNLFQTERCKLIVANQQIATLTESLRVAEEKLAGVEAIAGEWIPRTELLEILHPETKGAKVTTTPPPASDAKPSFHIERIVDGKVSCYTVHHTGIDCFIEDLPTGGMRLFAFSDGWLREDNEPAHKGWLDPDSVDALHRRLNAALVLNSNQSDELSLQSAEIARLERENATYHADATEAVQLMIEAQKKRDEFRRAANEAKRELAAITAATAEKDAEIAKLEIDRDNWQASFTRLQAELAEAKGGSAR